jgi:hypothetical protein
MKARQYPFEQTLVGPPRHIACGRGAPIVRGNNLEHLRLGRSHATGRQAQEMRAFLDLNHGTDQVPFVAPKLQKTPAVRFADRVTGASHVEEQVAVFEQGRRRVFG